MPHRLRPDKAGPQASERLMAGIGVIIVFFIVLAVLNRLEFGRFD